MLKVISIHIPKTAGSTFSQILSKTYGKERLLKIYGMRGVPETIDLSIFPRKEVRKARILHGHFRYSQMSQIIKKKKPLLITWVRDPVDRVISNYFYSMYRIREGIASEDKNMMRNFSLLEYANELENRNMMSWFMEGSILDDYFFIGRKEAFQQDLIELGRKLKWPPVFKLPHQKDGSAFIHNNDCTTQYNDITASMKAEIAVLNKNDIRLYNEILNSKRWL